MLVLNLFMQSTHASYGMHLPGQVEESWILHVLQLSQTAVSHQWTQGAQNAPDTPPPPPLANAGAARWRHRT